MRIENEKIHLSSLEYFLGDRCNLRCRCCSASSPYLKDSNLPVLDLFRQELSCLAPVLTSDQIKFVGGEPLLNKSVCDFLQAARDSGVFRQIRVTTNGVLLPRMTDAFWELADVVEISRYPGVERPSEMELSELSAKAQEHQTKLEVNRVDRFMVPYCDQPNPNPAMVDMIFRTCGEANNWSCHLLYRGRLYRCSRVHTLDRYLTSRSVKHEAFTEIDGLPIDGRPSLLDDIRDYLTSKKPLGACSFCLGTAGRWMDNRQLNTGEIEKHLAAPPTPFEKDLVVSVREAQIRNQISTWAVAAAVKAQGRF